MAQAHLQALMGSLRDQHAQGHWRRLTVRVAAVLVVTGVAAACSGASSVATPGDSGARDVAASVCSPGRSVACVGAGGCAGGQVCLSSGMGYGACDCNGADASVHHDATASDSSTGADAAQHDAIVLDDVASNDAGNGDTAPPLDAGAHDGAEDGASGDTGHGDAAHTDAPPADAPHGDGPSTDAPVKSDATADAPLPPTDGGSCEFATGIEACNACLTASCCFEEQACMIDPTCASCLGSGMCSADNVPYANLIACVQASCSAPCLSTPDAAADAPAPKDAAADAAPPTTCGLASSDPACESCLSASCCSQALACANDPTCITCLGTGTCSADAPYTDFMDCIEASCSAACTASPPDAAADAPASQDAAADAAPPASCGLTSGVEACDACLAASCCASEEACASDTTCVNCLMTGTVSGATCAADTAYTNFGNCYLNNCEAQCDG